jgi:hypothetical protein
MNENKTENSTLNLDLSGGNGWKVDSEEENENYTSFFLNQGEQQAEVTLYHSGFAQVDINGLLVFHGDMLEKSCKKAKLHYYRMDSGDKILLN